MSVKFGDVQNAATAAAAAADTSIRADTKELAHKVGERLTGGNPQTGYLAVRSLCEVREFGDRI
jgi:hypothetical protein